ncbi:serine/threonine-protein kinase 32A [Neocloeon triangulifer]|uniref:serine/threonine-protein kinase 32A n=1 Tax=Neocloeon triangulifer TaxID=2078957 RepID=UPI00286F2FA5|nr:serine/threonine-protein kinase 32A [Neocloeon triangulifer]
MGAMHPSNRREVNRSDSEKEEVNFDHFQILRAIGKGSFGKVCIVRKRDSGQLYAMKYMSKAQCRLRDALKNVLREVEILASLDHPFLVNLWFSFQDEEDLFLVTDLMLGGDLRYHLSQRGSFSESSVTLFVYELSLALDYLQSRSIVHRDIKPDNILLDEEGHAHITDFNIASVLEEGQLATSMSGTKPYMAPEIFACAADECVGYSFAVDWWSLGVVAFELVCGSRPFDIHSSTLLSDVQNILATPPSQPTDVSDCMWELLTRLLSARPGERPCSLQELPLTSLLPGSDKETILSKSLTPQFTPPKGHLNCDPTFELEEMIIEARPLHKKKKRLAKQRSIRENQPSLDLDPDLADPESPTMISEFRIFNREREIERKEREEREAAWEQELIKAMNASGLSSIPIKKSTAMSLEDDMLLEEVEEENDETEPREDAFEPSTLLCSSSTSLDAEDKK